MAFIISTISPSATYQLSKSITSVDEGSQVTITLNTTGVQVFQQIPYTITGTNISPADFVAMPSLTGNFTIQNNTAIAILTTAADSTTEGSETFTLSIPHASTSISVNINDTSIGELTPPQNLWRTLNNPNPYGTSASDYFGFEVDISGNYAIVGAYGEDEGGNLDSGKAYIFDVSTGALVHTLDNPRAGGTGSRDQFGRSVGISGNYAIVGAPGEEEASWLDSGKAYIFDVSTGALVHTLNNPNAYGTAEYDQFGYTVDISGNYAIVGALNEDDAGGSPSGKVYVFDVQTGTHTRTLNNPTAYGTSLNDLFGNAIAVSGNYAIVGAWGEADASGARSGKAYIFDVSTGALVHTLDNPNPYGTSVQDLFGVSVDISGNYAIVGAYWEDEAAGKNSGKAYIFDVSTGALVHTLNNPNAHGTVVSDHFGGSVGISGNYAIVGAHYESAADGAQSGKAYIFDVSTGALVRTLDNPNVYGASAGDYFGFSVGISGNHAIVGALNEDDASGADSGAVYIFN